MISLLDLKYYLEICKEKNILAASKKLYVAQPLLTRVLKRMEEELGTKLIQRTTRNFIITDEGSVVQEYAERILKEYDDMMLNLEKSANNTTSTVRLNVAEVFIDRYFVSILPQIMRSHPDVKLILTHDTSHSVVQSISEGKLDGGIIMSNIKSSRSPSIQVRNLIEDELYVMVGKNHPFVNYKSVDIMDLRDKPIAIFNKSTAVYNQFIKACYMVDFSPYIQYECATLHFNAEVIKNSETVVGIMPRPYLYDFNMDDIRAVPLIPSIKWNIAMAYKRDLPNNSLVKQVIEEICEMFPILEE